MKIIECSPDVPTDRMYCPSTDEVIFAPEYEEMYDGAKAFVAAWHSEVLDKPMIKDANLEAAWNAIYSEWNAEEDPELDLWDLLDKFLTEHENPAWIVYECTFYGMACGPVQTTIYFVVKADTIIAHPEAGSCFASFQFPGRPPDLPACASNWKRPLINILTKLLLFKIFLLCLQA